MSRAACDSWASSWTYTLEIKDYVFLKLKDSFYVERPHTQYYVVKFTLNPCFCLHVNRINLMNVFHSLYRPNTWLLLPPSLSSASYIKGGQLGTTWIECPKNNHSHSECNLVRQIKYPASVKRKLWHRFLCQNHLSY